MFRINYLYIIISSIINVYTKHLIVSCTRFSLFNTMLTFLIKDLGIVLTDKLVKGIGDPIIFEGLYTIRCNCWSYLWV